MGLFGRGEDSNEYAGYKPVKDESALSEEQQAQIRRFNGKAYLPEKDSGLDPSLRHDISHNLDEKYGDRKRDNGASTLRQSDAEGTKKGASVADNLKSVRNAETGLNGGLPKIKFTGKGKDRDEKGGFSARRMFKNVMPLVTIFGSVAGFGAIFSISQMAMPFSLISQFQSSFDSIGTSAHLRANAWFKLQTNPTARTYANDNRIKDFTKSHSKLYQFWNGNSNDYFKISSRQTQKLKNAGIDVEIDAGTGQSVLKFTQTDGTRMTVVPDQSMANGSDRIYIQEYYDNNTEFHNAYYAGARTWRGSVSSWFDKMANKFLGFFGVSRGVWANYKKSLDANTDMANFRSGVEDNASSNGIKGSANEKIVEDEEVDDGNGGTEVRQNITDGSTSLDIPKGSTREKVAKAAQDFVSSKVANVASQASQVANFACMVTDVIGAINLIVMAYQMTQIIKVASSIFEGIQKAQVEDSSTTPINSIGQSLTTEYNSEVELPDLKNTASNSQTDVATKKEKVTGSAMEAEGIKAIYRGTTVDTNDPSIASFNISNSVNGILKALGSSAAAYKACTFAKIGAAAVEGIIDTVKMIGCIATAGIGCAFDALFDVVTNSAKIIGRAILTQVVISAIVPFFANIAIRTIATDVAGEDLGNALASGASSLMGSNHQYSGGAPASKESYLVYLTAMNEVEQDKAYFARTTLSPFDYTSQYTFLGSLVNKFMIPLSIEASSITSGISSFANTVGKAFSTIMPGASAVDVGVKVQEIADQTATNCPDLDAIGAIGDGFCNPYIITDMSTIEQDPAYITYKVSELDSRNFDLSTTDTDTPKINEKSRLGSYILYCGQRQSPFGLADQNISSDFQNWSTGSSVGDSLIGAVPIVGSVVDMVNNSKVIANYGYVTGESCVTGNAVEAGTMEETGTNETTDWAENKYYQRFIEDQRLAENMGLVEKSSVTAFLDDYYERNPIDDSYEGVLARRSGLTKDQVIATIDIVEALIFVANYDPDGYAPLNYSEPTEEKLSLEDSIFEKSVISGKTLAISHNNDTDRRYVRNFAA